MAHHHPLRRGGGTGCVLQVGEIVSAHRRLAPVFFRFEVNLVCCQPADGLAARRLLRPALAGGHQECGGEHYGRLRIGHDGLKPRPLSL